VARRGEQLREHILWSAKAVFLEMGFERASMDVVAARAETSKRSLYAHFENKDTLFAQVVELVRGLYLQQLKTPGDYDSDSAEAVVRFCGRFLQLLMWESVLRTCRLGVAEADRLPDASGGYYDAIFVTTHERLAAFLAQRYELSAEESADLAEQLLGRTVYPRLIRAFFGVEPLLPDHPESRTLETDVDLAPIRRAVAALLPG